MVIQICNLSYTGCIDRRIMFQGWPRQKVQAFSKSDLKAKRARGMTQVAEHLPNQCKVLRSNSPVPPRRKGNIYINVI
jgi:hypothetical protein